MGPYEVWAGEAYPEPSDIDPDDFELMQTMALDASLSSIEGACACGLHASEDPNVEFIPDAVVACDACIEAVEGVGEETA